MGDIADILGYSKASSSNDEVMRFLDEKPKHTVKKSVSKPKGMSREVFMLQQVDGLLPSMPVAPILQTAFKDKRQSIVKGKWVWESFLNPARRDRQTFFHWTKAENVGSEYPWAKFNTSMERISYSDQEYEMLLITPGWTRAETDALVSTCFDYDLRWPVIHDRYEPPVSASSSSSTSARRLEDLQARFFDIVSKLNTSRAAKGLVTIKIDSTLSLNMQYEKNRRTLQEAHFFRFKEEDYSLNKMKDELRNLTTTNKKKSRSSKAANAKLDTSERGTATDAAATVDPATVVLHSQPKEGKPCLQSTRLTIDAKATSTISKTLFGKLQLLLKEVSFPDDVIPTRAAMDLMDTVRKNAMGLLSIQGAVKLKQKKIDALRTQLGDLAPDQQRIPVPYDVFVPAPAVPVSVIESITTENTKRKSVNIKKKKRVGGFSEGNQPVYKKQRQEGLVKSEPTGPH